MNILFITSDKSAAGKVSGLLKNSDIGKKHALNSCSIFELEDALFDAADLLIIDLSSITDAALENLPIAKLNNVKKLKLIILDLKNSGLFKNNAGFFVKPDDIIFNDRLEKELMSRISILMSQKIPKHSPCSLVIGGLALDPERYSLSVDGNDIELTFKEYELLKILLENQNKVFSRIKLLSSVWGYDFYGGSRTVDVHMRRLRSKLAPPYCVMLKTVRNVGYMFSPTV